MHLSEITNVCKWLIKTSPCNTHRPCLFTAWMLKVHLDLKREMTVLNWLKQYMSRRAWLGVIHRMTVKRKNLYLREVRYWLKFTESKATRKVFSATSLA